MPPETAPTASPAAQAKAPALQPAVLGQPGAVAQLHATPDNPIPGNPVVMDVVAADGMHLRVARWKPSGRGPAKGTVCILQGRAEFVEKYFEVVRDLRRRGFAVVAFDWRGQGLSGRQVGNARKGHVRAFADYRLDLDAVRDKVLIPHMPRPHFALAHSMGAAVALNEAAEGRLPFERLVASAPMIGLSMVKRPKVVARVALAMNLLGFGRSFVPGGGETSIATKPFPGNRLTSDPVRYARNAASAYAVGAGAVGEPTVAWLHGAFKLMRKLSDPRLPLRIRLPTLILAAGADPVCDTRVIERFAARLKAGHAIVFPGARHEVMMERDAIRELFWAAFDAFVPGSSGLKEAPAVGEYAGVDDAEEPQDRAPAGEPEAVAV